MRRNSGNQPRIEVRARASPGELTCREHFLDLFKHSPLPPPEALANLGLFLNRQTLSRILFMHELYQQALPVHGVVMEFGTRWGQNATLFGNFRGIYEPYNYTRKVVAFDTFQGFPTVDAKDGADPIVKDGAYAVTDRYEEYLRSILAYHESESPLAHIQKYELVKGDCGVTLKQYLDEHPETIVALAYFDVDLYEPTVKCLELLRKHLTRGSVIGFDELNFEAFPGETVAVREAIGLDKYSIKRSQLSPTASYLVID
jgi:Macrocin-O-methyltransferase (TylF)